MEFSKEQIEAYAKHFGIDLADGSQEAGIVGSLTMWSEGKGELAAKLVDHPATRELFKPIRSAYFAAQGVEEPAYSESLDLPEEEKKAE